MGTHRYKNGQNMNLQVPPHTHTESSLVSNLTNINGKNGMCFPMKLTKTVIIQSVIQSR